MTCKMKKAAFIIVFNGVTKMKLKNIIYYFRVLLTFFIYFRFRY
jgi:hypothetical protein